MGDPQADAREHDQQTEYDFDRQDSERNRHDKHNGNGYCGQDDDRGLVEISEEIPAGSAGSTGSAAGQQGACPACETGLGDFSGQEGRRVCTFTGVHKGAADEPVACAGEE